MPSAITSPSNARIKRLRAALEDRRKAADGLVALEGPNLVHEAIDAGAQIDSVYVREDHEWASRSDVTVLSRGCFASIAATDNAQGIAALIEVPQWKSPSLHDGLFLVVEAVQDPGNLGTLVRSAQAFGARAVFTLPGTVDVWNQKSLRASAGAALRLPVISTTLASLNELPLIAAVARDGATPESCDLRGACGIMIGNEGAGLSEEALSAATARVTIPCPGQVESLNAAIAGSVLLYAASLQRSAR